MNNITELLFNRAYKQLEQTNITKENWTFGGGTVLKILFNHRQSKDIDIFFNNIQLLSYISPRINDANERDLKQYSELSNFIKLSFSEGDVDFIVADQISNIKSSLKLIFNKKIFIDDPIEIILKKLYYRSEDFTPRDIFDLATVYSKYTDKIIDNYNYKK